MASPGVEMGYALDFHSVVRHVATQLERARSSNRALSVAEMAKNLGLIPGPADITRVRHYHKLNSDIAAKRFLVERAIEDLRTRGPRGREIEQIATDNGSAWLAVSGDELRYKGKKLTLYEEKLTPEERADQNLIATTDLFNPMSGMWADNIRSNLGDLTELVESMKAFGWIEELGVAIQDERGVILVGHRRLAAAEEAGVDPIITTIRFGKGDAADAERAKLAIFSNIGQKPFTKPERERIAYYLYNEREWSQQRIAEVLGVSRQLVGYDIAAASELPRPGNSDGPRQRGRREKVTDEHREFVKGNYTEFGGELNRQELADELGLSTGTISKVAAELRGEDRGKKSAKVQLRRKQMTQEPEPEPEPECEHTRVICADCGEEVVFE